MVRASRATCDVLMAVYKKPSYDRTSTTAYAPDMYRALSPRVSGP
jgi:hypothetical protein